MRSCLIVFLAAIAALPALAAEKSWVSSDRLNSRTCPAIHCGIVGHFFYRERVTIYEVKNGWARVSKYYDASCRNGKSEYVDSGDAKCSPANGVKNGKFAEWVSLQYLAAKRPSDPGAGTVGIAKLVSQSDDFRKYKSAFVKASTELMASGKCTKDDFEKSGGWVKSTTTYHDRPVYFTYCGGLTHSNRLYLDASNGRIFQ